MSHQPEWELRRRRDNSLVAVFHSCNTDFPWMMCDFEPTAEYEEYHSLFEEQEMLIEQMKPNSHESPERLDAIHYELNDELVLTRIRDSMLVSEFLMRVRGREVHFRFILDKWKK